jgi:hypothetical protein
MSKELQPIYKVLINGVDVTTSISGEITLEEGSEFITNLQLTLSGKAYLLGDKKGNSLATDAVKIHDKIYMEGGAGDPQGLNYKPFFRGFVKYVRPRYTDAGTISVALECVGDMYRSAINKNFYIYPSSNCARAWARQSSIKASEFVRNMITEMGGVIGKDDNGFEDIKISYDMDITNKLPITQKNESDWGVLMKLAKRLNCKVWSTFNSNGLTPEVHFVDVGVLRGEEPKGSDKLIFHYPLRSANGGFHYLEKKPNYQYLRGVTVEHDFAAMDATKRVITTFNYQTGEEINIFEAKITENGKEVVKYFTFEVDEDKLSKLSPEARKDVEKIAGSIAGDEVSPHSINEIAPYFKPAKFYTDRTNKFLVDKPHMGITIRATCDGNVNILSRKNYQIMGVGRYGSDNLEQSYYLKTVTHTWGGGGYETQMEFIL